jgi:flagellum-specific peptidoglycan hydrolase FlgJ
MSHISLKRLIISQFIKFRVLQNRFTMITFIKKNWFYIGLAILGLALLNKKMPGVFPWSSSSKKEIYTEKQQEGGQSLFGLAGTNEPAVTISVMPDIEPEVTKPFLKRFAKVVQDEQEKYHIPASALLALAYVNSHSGTRALSTASNNYFARTCGANWDGPTTEVAGQCYRSYETAWASFRDASEQMSATRWAQKLIKDHNKKPEDWIEAFEENGYSDVKDAGEAMKKVLKGYRLFELD